MSQHRTIDGVLEDARARLARLAPPAALDAQRRGALVVDIRCEELRRETGTIPGSVHVPLSVLPWRFDPTSESHDPRFTDHDRHVVLVCAHGYSSSLAAATLQDLGFASATDVVGGMEGWLAAGLPVEPPAAR